MSLSPPSFSNWVIRLAVYAFKQFASKIEAISADGQMDTSIAIRTLLCEDNKIHCWGGGGIIADSEIEQEYRESIAKVQVLMETLEQTFKHYS